MTDEQTPAFEAGEEVVQTEAVEVEAPEAVDSTEGQVETQPADDEAEATADAETEDQKSKSQRRREQRKAEMERLRAAEAEAKERAEEAQRRLDRVKEAAKALPKPVQADFKDYEEYQAALAAYHSVGVLDRREMSSLEADAKAHFEAARAAQDAQRRQYQENWAEQAKAGREKYRDFDQVALRGAPIDQRMAELIVQSDVAADVAYFLGKRPDLVAQLATLPDVNLAREIGRIEATVSAATSKPISTAPEPIAPVRSRATTFKDPDKMTAAEWRAWREKGGTP